jgi:hypothetical protein
VLITLPRVPHFLQGQGIGLPVKRPPDELPDATPLAAAFTAWYEIRNGRVPSPELTSHLATSGWTTRSPGTECAISPRRSWHRRQLIGDHLSGEVRTLPLELLPEWVRWLGEHAELPPHLLEPPSPSRATKSRRW